PAARVRTPSCHCPFLSCPRHPRYLHSFPTRRSSDLGFASARELSLFRRPLPSANLGFLAAVPHDGGEEAEVRGGQRPAPLTDARSEEHTSELQSLTNLVCRLLLDKKPSIDCTATTHP